MRTLIEKYKRDEAETLSFLVLFFAIGGLWLILGVLFSIPSKSQAPIVPVTWLMTFVFAALTAMALAANIIAGVRRLRIEDTEESASRM